METNEVVDTSVVETVVDNTQTTEQTVDLYEEQAKNQGWKPKDEWEGDEDKWRPAKEFIERGEIFNKMDTINKELKETRKALKMLQEHHTKVKETEFKRAVDELKQMQKKHLEDGNSDGYLETTELLTDLKAEQKAREVVEQNKPAQVDPRFTKWVDENKWYTQNPEMRKYADSIGIGYANSNAGVSPEEVLEYVEQEVKERFKSKFVNPNRSKPSAVESSKTAVSSTSNKFELSDDERRVMNTFVRTGVMTKEEYIEQVKILRGVK